jgi:hypothetical protein
MVTETGMHLPPSRAYVADRIGEDYARTALRWRWSEVQGRRALVVEFPPERNLTLVVLTEPGEWEHLLA